MKKLLLIAAALVLTVGTAGITVSAHGGHHGSHRSSSVISYCCSEDCSFCDSDNDGLCDSCGNRGYHCSDGCEYIDEDNDGICDNCNTKSVCSVKPKRVRRGHCHR